MNPETILHERGSVAVVVHKDQLNREEKDAVRYSDQIVAMGDYFGLLIQEEPEDEAEALALAAYEEFEDDQKTEPIVETEPGGEPTMADLRGLTVASLRELAGKEEVDLSGLTLKDDILGRMAAHFGLDPAE